MVCSRLHHPNLMAEAGYLMRILAAKGVYADANDDVRETDAISCMECFHLLQNLRSIERQADHTMVAGDVARICILCGDKNPTSTRCSAILAREAEPFSGGSSSRR